MGNSLPGCGACIRKDNPDSFDVSDKEVAQRQKKKDKIEKMVKNANLNKDDFLSSQNLPTETTKDGLVETKSEKKSGKMNRETAKLLRQIYKANLVKKIQKLVREKIKNKKKAQLSIIDEKQDSKDDYEDIRIKNNSNNEVKSNLQQKNIKNEEVKLKEQIQVKETNFKKKTIDDIDKKETKVQKLDFEEVKENVVKTKKSENNYYYNKKSEGGSQYRQKQKFEEKEKPLIHGKFDMISIRGDSVQGETKSQFYFSQKGKDYRQTVNSIKEPEKNESGINRVNKSLLLNSPLDESIILI